MPFPLPSRREPRIDLSPLIDVVFQLLIFFVVTTTFLTDTGIPLALPAASSAQAAASSEALMVKVTADGAVRFRGQVVSIADLETKLREALTTDATGAVTIQGDGRVDYETIIAVMDAARRAKARGIVLATREAPAPASP